VKRTFLAVVCGAVLLASDLPHAQQHTFKSSTELVEVDAVVLDKAGNFVPGLKLEDVTVLENGKPQAIQQFFMVSHDLAMNEGPAASGDAQNGAHRVFVIMFDEAHLAPESMERAKLGAEHFVREMFTPDDAGGIFLRGGMYHGHLTSDKGELLSGIRSVQPSFETRQSILAPFRQWPRIPSESDASRIADGAREVTDALGADACREDPVTCAHDGGVSDVENQIQQKARLYVRQARMMAAQTEKNLDTVAHGLAKIPGRKTVVFISEGFFIEGDRSTVEIVAAQAARSGITIYSIDARGLINGLSTNPDVVAADRPRSIALDTGEDGPNILTGETGGFMVRNVDEITRAFGLIVRDTSSYYVIGYQPDNPNMDGKVRKLEVKTHLPGLKVRARKSYAAVKLPPQEAIWGYGK
jgi:VWFA-related protein